jgi:hypothetical protein
MKTKGNWGIKSSVGGYYCGFGKFDSQIRNIQIYHWKEKAEEQIEVLKKRGYLPEGITCEVIEVVEPKELKDTEAEWLVGGIFDDFLKCSNCGESWPWATAAEFQFCPRCGKYMTNHIKKDEE